MKKDLAGKKFGYLTVLEETEMRQGRQIVWRCQCKCGNEAFVVGAHLTDGHTKSCGCYAKEQRKKRGKLLVENGVLSHTTHGGTHERLYTIWSGMNDRCNNSGSEAYPLYGGRGIKLCDDWRDYTNFRAWAIQNGYDENAERGKCTIDRIDSDGDYCPENCRWVDIKAQCNNRRNNRVFEYNGEKKNIRQWADEVEIPYGTLHKRLLKYGWTIGNALQTPIRGAR